LFLPHGSGSVLLVFKTISLFEVLLRQKTVTYITMGLMPSGSHLLSTFCRYCLCVAQTVPIIHYNTSKTFFDYPFHVIYGGSQITGRRWSQPNDTADQ
jgi:hypothetical protein